MPDARVLLFECALCGEYKPRGEFTNYTQGPGGRHRYCRPCKNFYQRRRTAKWKFGLTPERYDSMLERQGGVCAICKSPPKNNKLSVDHDHACCPGEKSCGKCIRGLLCVRCNLSVEWMIENGERAEAYLNG